jgi:cbb3-type cytochrome oxidase maturation protein
VLLVFALMALFAWALHSRQFEDLQREGTRILTGDANLDEDQGTG